MFDFLGHELQVGDIVIVHEIELHDLFFARVLSLHAREDTVRVTELREPHPFTYGAKDIIWHSSAYHGVLDLLVQDLLPTRKVNR